MTSFLYCGYCEKMFSGNIDECTLAYIIRDVPLTEYLEDLHIENATINRDIICQQCEVDEIIPKHKCLGYHPWYPNVKFYLINGNLQ